MHALRFSLTLSFFYYSQCIFYSASSLLRQRKLISKVDVIQITFVFVLFLEEMREVISFIHRDFFAYISIPTWGLIYLLIPNLARNLKSKCY